MVMNRHEFALKYNSGQQCDAEGMLFLLNYILRLRLRSRAFQLPQPLPCFEGVWAEKNLYWAFRKAPAGSVTHLYFRARVGHPKPTRNLFISAHWTALNDVTSGPQVHWDLQTSY